MTSLAYTCTRSVVSPAQASGKSTRSTLFCKQLSVFGWFHHVQMWPDRFCNNVFRKFKPKKLSIFKISYHAYFQTFMLIYLIVFFKRKNTLCIPKLQGHSLSSKNDKILWFLVFYCIFIAKNCIYRVSWNVYFLYNGYCPPIWSHWLKKTDVSVRVLRNYWFKTSL